MSDQDINQQGAGTPKQSPFKPLTPAGDVDTTPRTVILKKPAGIPAAPAPTPAAEPAVVPAGIAITHAQAAKKLTARIDIASAGAGAPAPLPAAKPKTVRLRSPNKLTAPLSAPPPPSQTQAAAFAAVQPPITKSKTSRITLDTALSSAPSLPGHSDQPHTIRLKRPDDMVTPVTPHVAIKPPTTNISLPPLQPVHGDASAPQTAAVAAPGAEAAEDASPTRRKTIKVKRPTAKGTGRKLTLNKEAAAAAEPDAESENLQNLSAPDMTAYSKPVDKVNPFFIVAASIAIIVTLNLLWVFAAQTFGPQAAVSDFRSLVSPDMPPPIGALSINY